MTKWPRIGGWVLTVGYTHYSIANYIAIFIPYFIQPYSDSILMLNRISPHIISLPELTLSYTAKQNVIYRLVNVIYIHYNSMLSEISIIS